MTSGEWDLNALKALEEEEQKEFLALSQKNLFDPPLPPVATARLLFTNNNDEQQQQQNAAISGNANAQQAVQTSYVQYKLPTISECQAAKRPTSGSATPSSLPSSSGMSVLSAARLKLTRALSLSAHSLTPHGKKSPTSAANTTATAAYTPPAARRYATLHHAQPIRRTFHTLHQLERKSQRSNSSSSSSRHHLVATHKSPSLRRVAGTNKTYWQYGPPRISRSYEADSQISIDELPSGEVDTADTASCSVPVDGGDSMEMMRLIFNAASTAVNTLPLMTLTNSSSSSSNHGSNSVDDWLQQQQQQQTYRVGENGIATRGCYPMLAATATATAEATLLASPARQQQQTYNPNETVAYEAFHATARSKSFSAGTRALYHVNEQQNTLTSSVIAAPQGFVSSSNIISTNNNNKNNKPAVIIGPDNRKSIYKSASLDVEVSPPYDDDANIAVVVGGDDNASLVGRKMLRSTIITNPIMQAISRPDIEGLILARPYKTLVTVSTTTKTTAKTTIATATNATPSITSSGGGNTNLLGGGLEQYQNIARSTFNLQSNVGYQQQQQQQYDYQQQQQQQQQHQSHLQHKYFGQSASNIKTENPHHHHHHLTDIEQQQQSGVCLENHHNGDFIDDLEQHIKNCNCSCNHMGYGNSMDYQTTGFGGLPDVTEHSNIRRTLSRQNSNSNSDSGGDIASIQKSKVNFGDGTKSPSIASSQGIGSCAGVSVSGMAGSGIGGSVGRNSTTKRKIKTKPTLEHGTNGSGSPGNAEHNFRRPQRGICAYALTLFVAACLLGIAALLAYQHFIASPSRNSHAQRLRIVRRILYDVPLVDGHNNFAWNVRKYAHSSLELLHAHHEHDQKSLWTRPAWAQTDISRLRQGLIGMQVWSIYVPCGAQGMDAVQLALEQIDIIRRLTDMYADDTVLVESSVQATSVHRKGLMASLIGIEGGHAIASSLGVLRSFYSLGARYMSLTHTCDLTWAGSAASPLENGLTQFGKAVISEMNRLGMMIDLTYSSDATARDVLMVTRAPVIFSHSGARQLCNSTRNVPDEILRLVAENGGLIMISFDSEDVTCGRTARLQDVIAHIKYVRAIAGVQHIGLGAGYDGMDLPPVGLEDVTKYPDLLASLLEDHNWTEEDIAMLAGKNFLRIMETVENVRDYWKSASILPVEQSEPQAKSQCHYMSS